MKKIELNGKAYYIQAVHILGTPFVTYKAWQVDQDYNCSEICHEVMGGIPVRLGMVNSIRIPKEVEDIPVWKEIMLGSKPGKMLNPERQNAVRLHQRRVQQEAFCAILECMPELGQMGSQVLQYDCGSLTRTFTSVEDARSYIQAFEERE